MMRKKLGYSLENVSRDLYISKGSLSEMENGIRPMKKELFDRFLSTYDMEFSEDFCFVAKLKEVLSEEVDAFLWLDKNKQKKVRERFQKIKEKAEKSYACFLEKLIDYFEQVVLDHENGSDLFNELFEVQTCFSNDERALLFMIRGIEGRWNLTLRTMEADFERALRLADERELSGLKALIGYYQIYELQRKRISFAAQERCIEVRKQFHAMHNYLRALYLDNLEALGLSYLRAYESAYSRLQTLLKNIEYAKDEYLHFCVAQNAILVLCVMGRFSEALALMQKEKSTFQYGLSNFVFAPYCLYRLGRKEQTIATIRELEPYIVELDDRLLNDMVMAAFAQDRESFFKAATRLLALDQKRRLLENVDIDFQFIIHFCREMGLKEELIEAQDAYIAFLNVPG